MEFRYFFKLMLRNWWVILIVVLIAVNFSLVNSYYLTTPLYDAVASLIVSPNVQDFERSSDLADSLANLDKRSIVATYAEVIDSRQVYDKTFEILEADSEQYQEYTNSVVVLPEANVINITVSGPNPEVAAVLANSIGQYSIDLINSSFPVYSISFVDRAEVPPDPTRPRPAQDALLAVLLGLVAGVGLVILQDQFSISMEGLSQRKQIDSVSSAFSRNYFEQSLREEIASKPESDLSLGFLYLNGIQDVYDSLPQVYVNRIMQYVFAILDHNLRGNDIVGRWSNLQFGVLLPNTPGGPAKQTLGKILEKLEQPLALETEGDFNINLDPRIGVAERQIGESFVTLLESAEDALEIARQSEDKIYYKQGPSPE